MMTPKKIEAALTARCNLRCVYCAHFSSASDVTHDLSTAEWLAFFEELNRCAVLRIVLSGGEVFCRSDLRELIHGIVKNRMRFSLLTNGTQIDDAIIDFIAATGRCDTVQVSVDGSRAQIHDATRGEGSFIRATEGIKTLKKYGIAVSVRVTINKYNVYDLEEITRLLLEEVGLNGFSTNEAGYQGLCRQNSEKVQLDIEEYSSAMRELLRLNKKYNNRISAAAGPLANARLWLKMVQAHTHNKETFPGAGDRKSVV